MPGKRVTAAGLVVLAAAVGGSGCSSATPKAEVSGVLRTVGGPSAQSGGPVPGTVTFVDQRTGRRTTAQTDADGKFTVKLAPGEYRVTGRSRHYDGGAGVCMPAGPVLVSRSGTKSVLVACSIK